ncbi:hypothetical protein [Macrococcus brunensis]|uniref:hypothetical protein n=1 Tax=Macrococcus brunensis TaxID=198483 RepID=UPI001EF0A174|nr:hypothetical protein [Macrococcus brunensis]ULG73005.1 hypothetical protein MGG12_05670 [Macrococcus brunensis]
MARTKTRKKLTEQEAKDRINSIATQIQTETEFYLIDLLPNAGKSIIEIDGKLRSCLSPDGYLHVDDAIEDLRSRVSDLCWKIQEDLSRFLPDGHHRFIGGLTLSINREKEDRIEEQLTLF